MGEQAGGQPGRRVTVSAQLWQASAARAADCLASPFVSGLRDGSLDPRRFAFYVGQDAFFLDAFARAYSVAAARAPTNRDLVELHGLAAGAIEELRLHDGYALELGIDLATVIPAPATRRYADFLLATAWSTDVGRVGAAMAPCMRLYAYLGNELASVVHDGHPYAAWIATYSSPDFESLARQLEELVDRHVESEESVIDAYGYAMTCELEFFVAAWNAHP
jgi:thiaminase/transcriptional activator TenA